MNPGARRAPSAAAHARASIVGLAFGFSATALASGFFGPFLLTPTLAIALMTGGLASSHIKNFHAIVALGIGSFALPACLEWTEIIPQSHVFGPEGIAIRPVILSFPEVPTRLAMLLGMLLAMLASSVVVMRVVAIENDLRAQLFLQLSHLRTMAGMGESENVAAGLIKSP